MEKRVYLDNAATTPVKEEVLKAMMPYFGKLYANPSANYPFAKEIMKGVETARAQVADLINGDPSEVFFTSGGTESDNWAIKAVAEKLSSKGKHIITSKIEHHAVLNTMQWLERKGFDVTYLTPDKDGIVGITDLENAIRPDTILISIMAANNEIGTIQSIEQIGKIAHKHGILFHTDAVQAFGHIPIDVKKMKIDLLSASGHKINGPKGVGVLYAKKGINIEPFMHGGAQEHGRRGGTYNVPGIVGMGMAANLAKAYIVSNHLRERRDYFINRIINEIPMSYINGDVNKRLPNNINVRFDKIDAESLLVLLGQHGICASVGSACTTGQAEPSHVLMAIGLTREQAHNSLRITISEDITIEDMDYSVDKLKECIVSLRG